MKRITLICTFIFALSNIYGQYRTANETINFINSQLKNYSIDGFVHSNVLSINSSGQIIITNLKKNGVFEWKMISTANIKDLKDNVSSINNDSDENQMISVGCIDGSKCISRRNIIQSDDRTTSSKYFSISFHNNSNTNAIITALSYLIKNTKQDSSFLNGIDDSDDHDNFIGCSFNGHGNLLKNYDISENSGDVQVDEYVKREVYALRNFFLINPSFFFTTEESPQAKNAFATPEVELEQCPSGTVVFGRYLIQAENSLNRGNTTVPIIIAHEFGHILDFNKNATPRPGIRKELFADFMAGCYLFYRSMHLPTDPNSALKAFFEMGDYSEYNNPNHHGRPEQRVEAILAGYNWLRSITSPGKYISPDSAIIAAKSYLDDQGIN
jgi:hypothetical protein